CRRAGRRDGRVCPALQRRADRAALRRRLWLRRRRPPRALPEGSPLALLAAHLRQPPPPRMADDSIGAGRLACRASAGAGDARIPSPGTWGAVEAWLLALRSSRHLVGIAQ